MSGVFDRGEIVLIGLADQKAPPAIVSRVQRFRCHGLNRQDCRGALPFLTAGAALHRRVSVMLRLAGSFWFECDRRCPWDLHWVPKVGDALVFRNFFSSSLPGGRFTRKTLLLVQHRLAWGSKQEKGMKYEKTRKLVFSWT